MHPALTWSLVALCAAAFVSGFVLDRASIRGRWPALARWSLVVQLAAIAGAWLVLRPGSGVDGRSAMARSAAAGRPLLLDVYSNY
jgi:hypothetical protein